LLFVILFGAILVGAFAAIRWYDTNSYFVGVSKNELVIYQGRIGGFLWYHPVEVERTGATTADVPGNYLGALNTGVEESSVGAARAYVSNLVNIRQQQLNPQTPATSTATTAPPSPTTTKVT
jgi:protein phosphatase